MSKSRSSAARVRRVSGAVVALIGGTVLVGWTLDVAALKSLHPAWVTMKANTAIGFVLSGLAIVLLESPRTRRGLAIPVALLGLLTLSEYLFRRDLGIDQAIFREPSAAVETSHPGRMAPTTALCFILISLAVLLPDRGALPQIPIFLAAAIALMAAISYLYGVKPLRGISSYTQMAAHTAGAFLVAAAGLLAARPDRGVTGLVTSPAAGGVLARRLLPTALIVILALGSPILTVQRIGLSLSVMASLVIFSALILVTSRHLTRFQEERDRYFSLSVDLLCVAGVDGRFKRLNPAWEKTLGWTLDELLEKPYLDFVHPDERASTEAAAKKLAAGDSVTTFENRYRHRDGSYRWLSWTARAPAAGQSEIFAVARDVTERVRADEELEAFSYSVSHDLRAPLRHIDGFAALLQKHAAPSLDPTGRRYVATISESAKRMGRLIDDLLHFSRTGRAEMRLQTVDLDALVRDVVRETEGRVAWDVRPLPAVRGDGALLRQALSNLVSNAVKYSRARPEPRVEIGAREDPREVVVWVRDNGVGFDMRYAGKLFGVFQRLHGSDEFEGTGIGLANVRRIAQRHGGRTWAEGRVGEGATFFFSVPR